MTEVRFKVKFFEHKKGDKVKMSKEDVKKYVDKFQVAEVVKPRPNTKQTKSAPVDKQVKGAANKSSHGTNPGMEIDNG